MIFCTACARLDIMMDSMAVRDMINEWSTSIEVVDKLKGNRMKKRIRIQIQSYSDDRDAVMAILVYLTADENVRRFKPPAHYSSDPDNHIRCIFHQTGTVG